MPEYTSSFRLAEPTLIKGIYQAYRLVCNPEANDCTVAALFYKDIYAGNYFRNENHTTKLKESEHIQFDGESLSYFQNNRYQFSGLPPKHIYTRSFSLKEDAFEHFLATPKCFQFTNEDSETFENCMPNISLSLDSLQIPMQWQFHDESLWISAELSDFKTATLTIDGIRSKHLSFDGKTEVIGNAPKIQLKSTLENGGFRFKLTSDQKNTLEVSRKISSLDPHGIQSLQIILMLHYEKPAPHTTSAGGEIQIILIKSIPAMQFF
jgi:hypothetical protein